MTTFLYTIRDKVAEESGPIFEAKNRRVAKRSFQELIAKTLEPSDYELLELGSFDHENNLLNTCVVEKVDVSLSEPEEE